MTLVNDEQEALNEYLEALRVNREVEFVYDGVGYRFEPNYEKGGYDVWKYLEGFKTGGGAVVASGVAADELLEMKYFNGKSFAEIENDATNKLIL